MTEHSGDFLDSGMYGETAAADESDPSAAAPPSGFAPYGVPASATGTVWKSALRPTACLAAGVVAGAVVVAAWHSSQNSSASLANPAAAQGQLPNGQAPNAGPGFGGSGGGPGFGGPGGGRNGEQHVAGTVTATDTASVTVRLANGSTATYEVIASSDIVKNGARVSLSAIKVGDSVFLHVYPSNGQTVVEHLFVGNRENPRDGAGTTTKT